MSESDMSGLNLAQPETWPVVLTDVHVIEILACPGSTMKDRRRHLHDRYVHRGVLQPIGGVPATERRLPQSMRYSRSDVWSLIGYQPQDAPTADRGDVVPLPRRAS